MDAQILINDFTDKYPEYKGKMLEVQIHDAGRYDIDLIKKNGKRENIRYNMIYEPKIYGYARISTKKQSIQRQIDNIKAAYPDAIVVQEEFTGATTDRPVINNLVDRLIKGDTVVFDEVSRMSRNAEEGIELYINLFDKGINLVFLKETHINTEVYRSKINSQIEQLSANTGSKATDKLISAIFDALREYTIALAKEQIELSFKTAQAELDYLKRLKESHMQRNCPGGR